MTEDSERKARVLLVVYLGSHFAELSRVARLLAQSERYAPVILFAQPYESMSRDLESCSDSGIRCLNAQSHPMRERTTPTAPGSTAIRARLRKSPVIRRVALGVDRIVLQRARRLWRGSLISTAYWVRSYRATIEAATEVIRRENISLLVLAEDNVGYTTAHWIKAASDNGVPSAIVPFTISNATEPAENLWDEPEHQLSSLGGLLIARQFPQWSMRHRGRALQRLPAPRVIAAERLGLAPPLPWVINSGQATVIAAESERMVDFYVEAGISREKLVLTGSLADDAIAAALAERDNLRETVWRELQLPVRGRLALLALPPDQNFSERTEFESYREMSEWLVGRIAALPDCALIVRPHPRHTAEEMRYLERHNVRVTQRDTASLIAICDLYVACASATIRWAIAARRPVINYDVFQYGYSDYAGAPGVTTVKSRSQFEDALAHMAAADPGREGQEQDRNAVRWGELDGGAGRRTIQLFDSLLAKSPRGAFVRS